MGLWEDVRFAARLLVKDKWFTLVAAIALALGIGVNTTVFTFVNAVLIRGLPIEDPDQVMALNSRDPVRNRNMGVSYLDYRDWKESARTFESLAAFTGNTANVSDEGKLPERYSGAFVTANTFHIMRQRPTLGRDFLPEDDRPGAQAVVLLGHGVWQNRYGLDPNVVGRTVRINDVPSVVIGVMPEGFKFPFNSDLWQPLSIVNGIQDQKRNARGLQVFGRLAPGVTRDQAQAEMINVGQKLTTDYPDTNKDVQPRIQTFNESQNGGPIRTVFLSLMGAVAFVLLIACANVANLLLARSTQRAREISVRISLGATRWRVIRQLLIESVLLALISGAIGLGISLVGIRLFDQATQDVGRPYWIQFTMDRAVFGYLAAICLGTGVIFGLAPALHVSKTDVNEVLKEGGRSGTAGIRARRWTSSLIVAELALTLVLLAGAGFMMRNFLTMYSMDLGMDTSKLLVMRLALPDRKYPALEQRLAFYQQIEERLKANPRIEAVTIASNMPLQGGFMRRLTLDGKPLEQGQQAPEVTMLTIDPRYFDTVGLPLIRGRGLTDEDGMTGRESAVINQQFAKLHFPNEDPIGRRIVLNMDLQGGAAPTGDGRRRLSALPDGSTRIHDAAGPQPGRPERDVANPARGSARHRRRPALVRHQDDGSRAGAGALALPHLRNDVRDLRVHRAGALCGRALRSDRLLGDAANAGDRRAHGAWRARQPGGMALPEAIVHPPRDRVDAGHRGRVRGRPALLEHSAADPDERARPDHDRRHRNPPGRRRDRGKRVAGTPCDAARSAHRASSRLIVDGSIAELKFRATGF